MDRAFGVLLVGARKPEIGQHPVAHVLGDEAVIGLDCPRTGVLKGPDNLGHVFGIEPR